jgi:hypothetical protein
MRVSADRDEDKEHREGLTRRGVWVVLGELHGRLEVTAVVQRVRVQYDKADVPLEDIFVIELDVYPILLSQRLVFVHQNTLRHGGDKEWKRFARFDWRDAGVLSRRVLQSR